MRPGLGVVERLRAAGWETYLVGGVVRDLLLGRPPADLDIVTAAPPDAVCALFDRTIPVGREFGVTAVIADGRAYEVAAFRREGPYLDGRRPAFVEPAGLDDDILRRDFTINALLYDPTSDEIIDRVGGRRDLEQGIIRTVGDPAVRFTEDRLRMLRAVRLAAELGFAVDPAALDAIAARAPEIASVSAERVRAELVRLVVAPGRAEGVRLLAHTGLLAAILPEVATLARRPASAAPHPNLLAQTIEALARLRRPTAPVATAVVLHLVEEPQVAEGICRRLRFSAAERRAVTALVHEHLQVPDLPVMRASELRRVLRRVEPGDLLEVYRVASLARGETTEAFARAAEVIAALGGTRGRTRPLLSGRDLLALGHVPGPAFARILEAVEAAHAAGVVVTATEARAWVRARFPAGAASKPAEPSPEPSSRSTTGADGG